jgi:hypothetical protein
MARKPRTYYTLVSKVSRNPDATWGVEFGDYVRSVVVDEMKDRQYDNRLAKKHEQLKFKIIAHLGRQDAAVALLNAGEQANAD